MHLFAFIFQTVITVLAITETYLVYTVLQQYVLGASETDSSEAEVIAGVYRQRFTRSNEYSGNTSCIHLCNTGSKKCNKSLATGSVKLRSQLTEVADGETRSIAYTAGEFFSNHFPKVKSHRMMIYTCNGKTLCGGWGDRLKGIFSVYFLSVLQNRTFGIEIRKPCTIEKFILPNFLDWKVSSEQVLGKRVGKVHILDKKAPPLTVEDIVEKVPNTDVVRVMFNEDYIDAFRSHKLLKDKFAFLNHFASSEIHRMMYHGLFRYEDSLEMQVKQFFDSQVGDHHLVSAHIRMGDQLTRHSQEDLDLIWNFLKQYRDDTASENSKLDPRIQTAKRNYKIFIASDTQKVKEIARKLFKEQYVGLSGRIIHTDRHETYQKENVCKGLRFSLLEHAVLARSDTLLLTKSGFGIEAAYIRHTSANLYCYLRKDGVVPCRPEALKAMYKR